MHIVSIPSYDDYNLASGNLNKDNTTYSDDDDRANSVYNLNGNKSIFNCNPSSRGSGTILVHGQNDTVNFGGNGRAIVLFDSKASGDVHGYGNGDVDVFAVNDEKVRIHKDNPNGNVVKHIYPNDYEAEKAFYEKDASLLPYLR